MGFLYSFLRYEQKYLMNGYQYSQMRSFLEGRTTPDEYGKTTICNVYFDTPDYRLIRNSVSSPVYKEKLRLRTYGVPDDGSYAFVEIKKKFDGLVSKRRVAMKLPDAEKYLTGEFRPQTGGQIIREIDSFLDFYGNLEPKMYISCDREAFFARENPEIRFTFDRNILCRHENVSIRDTGGVALLPPDTYLMEVKIPSSVPLWLSHRLDALKIYPVGYSKYGRAYTDIISAKNEKIIIFGGISDVRQSV